MNHLNDTLPDLMRRATENLEPESADLLDRTVRQGVGLRRRRTVLLGLSGAGAVLATAGLIVGGTQLVGRSGSDVAAAGTTVPAATASTAKPPVATAQQNLALLKSALQQREFQLTRPEAWGSAAEGYLGAAYVANDGNGASRIELVVSAGANTSCEGMQAGCVVRPDGSRLITTKERPVYPAGSNVHGVIFNSVDIANKNGTTIHVTSYNGPQEKGAEHTRSMPILSVEQLIALADTTAWKVPPEYVPSGKGK